MMQKMIFYMVLLGLGVFLFVSVARLLGCNLQVVKEPNCNYNCICESFEGEDCEDCEYNFTDFDCPLDEVRYAVRNLCKHAWCVSACEDYWQDMMVYYGVDNTTFFDLLSKYNESYCCLVLDLPNFLKMEGYYCGEDYRVHVGGEK